MADTIRYEDAAARERPPEGWICKKCRRWWADDEHMARWCCSTDQPCRTNGCAGRTVRGSLACGACRKRVDDEKWAATPKLPLPQNLAYAPLCLWNDDRYFFDMDDMYEYALDNGVSVRDLRLMICEPVAPPFFQMSEWLADHMPEDSECSDEHDAEINRLIGLAAPRTFFPGKYGVDPETIPLDEKCDRG